MEELQVGEFIRTKSGELYKIDYVGESVVTAGEEVIIPLNYIENYSFEPIDLVKKGDYVNGYKVYETDEGLVIFEINDAQYFVNPLELSLDKYKTILNFQDKDFIKSIVTSEKFASIEFKVEE